MRLSVLLSLLLTLYSFSLWGQDFPAVSNGENIEQYIPILEDDRYFQKKEIPQINFLSGNTNSHLATDTNYNVWGGGCSNCPEEHMVMEVELVYSVKDGDLTEEERLEVKFKGEKQEGDTEGEAIEFSLIVSNAKISSNYIVTNQWFHIDNMSNYSIFATEIKRYPDSESIPSDVEFLTPEDASPFTLKTYFYKKRLNTSINTLSDGINSNTTITISVPEEEDINSGKEALNNTITVSWSEAQSEGVDLTEITRSYDLEWVWIDKYRVGQDNSYTPPLPVDAFKEKEGVRINTIENKYTIDMAYPSGYLFFRLRLVQPHPDNIEQSVAGDWIYYQGYRTVYPYEGTSKNWQAVTTFAEEGKHKKVMTYYDRSLRAHQVRTNINSNAQNNMLVAETLYDYEGRASINILPVPTIGTLNYEHTNTFDFNPSDETVKDKYNGNTPAPVLSATNEANIYYSESGLAEPSNVFETRIPDAEGYPYSQTVYMQDQTGRVAEQGGVGATFQVGKGHTTKNYYANANQTELKRLFGEQVGYDSATHYRKDMVQDPNGQLSLSYKDREGKVLATALVGESTETNSSIFPFNDWYTPEEDDKGMTIDLGANTVVDQSSGTIKTVYSHLNQLQGGTLFLKDLVFAHPVTKSEEGNLCAVCTYRLEIKIINLGNGEEEFPTGSKERFSQDIDASVYSGWECEDISDYQENNINSISGIQYELGDIGAYKIIKTLTVTGGGIETTEQEQREAISKTVDDMTVAAKIMELYLQRDLLYKKETEENDKTIITYDYTEEGEDIAILQEIKEVNYGENWATDVDNFLKGHPGQEGFDFIALRSNLVNHICQQYNEEEDKEEIKFITYWEVLEEELGDTNGNGIPDDFDGNEVMDITYLNRDENEDGKIDIIDYEIQEERNYIEQGDKCYPCLNCKEDLPEIAVDSNEPISSLQLLFNTVLGERDSEEDETSEEFEQRLLQSSVYQSLEGKSNAVSAMVQAEGEGQVTSRNLFGEDVLLFTFYYDTDGEDDIESKEKIAISGVDNYLGDFSNNRTAFRKAALFEEMLMKINNWEEAEAVWGESILNSKSFIDQDWAFVQSPDVTEKTFLETDEVFSGITTLKSWSDEVLKDRKDEFDEKGVHYFPETLWQFAESTGRQVDPSKGTVPDTDEMSAKKWRTFRSMYLMKRNELLWNQLKPSETIEMKLEEGMPESSEDIQQRDYSETIYDSEGNPTEEKINVFDPPSDVCHSAIMAVVNRLETSGCLDLKFSADDTNDSATDVCYGDGETYPKDLTRREQVSTGIRNRLAEAVLKYFQVPGNHGMANPFLEIKEMPNPEDESDVSSENTIIFILEEYYDKAYLNEVNNIKGCLQNGYESTFEEGHEFTEEEQVVIDQLVAQETTFGKGYLFPEPSFEVTPTTVEVQAKGLIVEPDHYLRGEIGVRNSSTTLEMRVFIDPSNYQLGKDMVIISSHNTMGGFNGEIRYKVEDDNTDVNYGKAKLIFEYEGQQKFIILDDYLPKELLLEKRITEDKEALEKITLSEGFEMHGTLENNGLSVSTSYGPECTLHIAVIWDKDNQVAKLYLNGGVDPEDEEDEFKYILEIAGDHSPFSDIIQIGRRQSDLISNTERQFFEGAVANLKVWDKIFTKEEIEKVANEPTIGTTPNGLLIDWELFEDNIDKVGQKVLYYKDGNYDYKWIQEAEIALQNQMDRTIIINEEEEPFIYQYIDAEQLPYYAAYYLEENGQEVKYESSSSEELLLHLDATKILIYNYNVSLEGNDVKVTSNGDERYTNPNGDSNRTPQFTFFPCTASKTVYSYAYKGSIENGGSGIAGISEEELYNFTVLMPQVSCHLSTVRNLLASFEGDLYSEQTTTITENKDKYYNDCLYNTKSIEGSTGYDSWSETFTASTFTKEGHYTLYYYDQAGNLIRTLPPEAVKSTKTVSTGQKPLETTVSINYDMATNYRYNALNQLVWQSSPDGGEVHFIYDDLGRLRFSVNEKNLEEDKVAYTQYDALGRTTEAGEVDFIFDTEGDTNNNNAPDGNVSEGEIDNALAVLKVLANPTKEGLSFPFEKLESVEGLKTEDGKEYVEITVEENEIHKFNNSITAQTIKTYYDSFEPYWVDTNDDGDFDDEDDRKEPEAVKEENNYLIGRVAYVEAENKDGSTVRTFYRYDPHGNVNTLIQQLPDETTEDGFTEYQTDYEYDLISGNVNRVVFQKGKDGEQFMHRYSYDGDNRIKTVETSADGFDWIEEATYEYYAHGPLARVTLGEKNVQTLDYYYTLQGWIKGVNIGNDQEEDNNMPDVFSYALNYFDGDYKAIGQNSNILETEVVNSMGKSSTFDNVTVGRNLYNGNISSMLTSLPKEDGSQEWQAMGYRYDQLNRISDAMQLNHNTWEANNTYRTAYEYDANGNIQHLERYDKDGNIWDKLDYTYHPEKINRLNYVHQNGGANVKDQSTLIQLNDNEGNPEVDINDTYNYKYDKIGNLTRDLSEGIQSIEWNNQGKVAKVTKSDATVSYLYDASGNRVEKKVEKGGTTTITRYVRDASGNIMATYKTDEEGLKLSELPIYGSSRLGMYKGATSAGNISLGNRTYELSNHLGNVLATVSDMPTFDEGNNTIASVLSASDYYPFGLTMSGRGFKGEGYRFSFNGKEDDNDFSDNHLDFGARIYNTGLGRFLSIDPLTRNFPMLTPYQYASNTPIWMIDLDGLEGTQYQYRFYGMSDGEPILHLEHHETNKGRIRFASTGINYPWMKNHRSTSDVQQYRTDVMGNKIDSYQLYYSSKNAERDWMFFSSKEEMDDFIGQVDGDGYLPGGYGAQGVAVGTIMEGVTNGITGQKGINSVKTTGKEGCFTEITKVKTKNGYKNIEDIVVGDSVWAYNDTTHVLELKRVIKTFTRKWNQVLNLSIDGEVLSVTHEHPFYIKDKWLDADELSIGDTLTLFDNQVRVIDSIEIQENDFDVFNFGGVLKVRMIIL